MWISAYQGVTPSHGTAHKDAFTGHPFSITDVRATRYLAQRKHPCFVHVHEYCWTAYHIRFYEMEQGMELVSGKTAPVEYASDERNFPLCLDEAVQFFVDLRCHCVRDQINFEKFWVAPAPELELGC